MRQARADRGVTREVAPESVLGVQSALHARFPENLEKRPLNDPRRALGG